MSAKDRPEYAHLRAFKQAHQWDLMRRYGAHSLGIGWKTEKGKKSGRLALIFYVGRKGPFAAAGQPIPKTITYQPESADQPVELLTDVVEAPPARLEVEEGG